jgi:hypothetical protein
MTTVTSPVITSGESTTRLLQEDLVHVAPLPAFSGLEGAHDGMLGLMEMLGGVLVLGGIAAAHVPTDETFPQVDPGVADFEAFLAAFAAGSYFLNFL